MPRLFYLIGEYNENSGGVYTVTKQLNELFGGEVIELNRNGLKFLKQIFRFKSNDVIHFQGFFSFFLPIILITSRLIKFRVIISTHGMLENSALMLGNKLLKKFFITIIRFSKTRNCVFLTLNKSEEVAVSQMLNGNYITIFNAIHVKKFYLNNRNEKNILFLGRITEKKGVLKIIEFAERHKDFQFDFVGKDECGLFRTKTALKNVRYLGTAPLEKIPEILSNYSSFILPSISEGIPMAALEAIANGLYPYISKECNIDIQASDFKYIDPNSIEGWYEVIIKGNRELTFPTIVSEIEKKYGIKKFTNQFKRVYGMETNERKDQNLKAQKH